jgi:hypothetical protein
LDNFRSLSDFRSHGTAAFGTAAFAARRSIRSSGTSAARGGAPVIRDEVHRHATGCLASAFLLQVWFSRREAVGGGGISRAEDGTEVPPKKSRGG